MRTSIDGLGDAIMAQLEDWNENTVKRAANETFEELADRTRREPGNIPRTGRMT